MIDLLSILLILLGVSGVGREVMRVGQIALPGRIERTVFSAGLGYGVLILCMLILGLTGLLRPTSVSVVTGLLVAFGWYRLWICGSGRHVFRSARAVRCWCRIAEHKVVSLTFLPRMSSRVGRPIIRCAMRLSCWEPAPRG